jgi:hypothetical protein
MAMAMAMARALLLVGLLAALSGSGPTGASAQFPGMGKREEKKAPAVKADLPFIRCGACEAIAKQALKKVKAMREAVTPGKPVRATGAPGKGGAGWGLVMMGQAS